jgi:hypothetical protein
MQYRKRSGGREGIWNIHTTTLHRQTAKRFAPTPPPPPPPPDLTESSNAAFDRNEAHATTPSIREGNLMREFLIRLIILYFKIILKKIPLIEIFLIIKKAERGRGLSVPLSRSWIM